MKKAVFILLAVVMTVSLICGCSNDPRKKDAEKVKNILIDDCGCSEDDIFGYDEYVEKDGVIEKKTENKKEEKSFSAWLGEGALLSYTDYRNNKKDFESDLDITMGDTDLSEKLLKSEYETVEKTENGDYKLYIRVENTLLIITGPEKTKSRIREVARKIGYLKQ